MTRALKEGNEMNGEGAGVPTVSHGVQIGPLLYAITEELAAEALGQIQAKESALRGGPEGSFHLDTCHVCPWQVRAEGGEVPPGLCGLPHTKQQRCAGPCLALAPPRMNGVPRSEQDTLYHPFACSPNLHCQVPTVFV